VVHTDKKALTPVDPPVGGFDGQCKKTQSIIAAGEKRREAIYMKALQKRKPETTDGGCNRRLEDCRPFDLCFGS